MKTSLHTGREDPQCISCASPKLHETTAAAARKGTRRLAFKDRAYRQIPVVFLASLSKDDTKRLAIYIYLWMRFGNLHIREDLPKRTCRKAGVSHVTLRKYIRILQQIPEGSPLGALCVAVSEGMQEALAGKKDRQQHETIAMEKGGYFLLPIAELNERIELFYNYRGLELPRARNTIEVKPEFRPRDIEEAFTFSRFEKAIDQRAFRQGGGVTRKEKKALEALGEVVEVKAVKKVNEAWKEEKYRLLLMQAAGMARVSGEERKRLLAGDDTGFRVSVHVGRTHPLIKVQRIEERKEKRAKHDGPTSVDVSTGDVQMGDNSTTKDRADYPVHPALTPSDPVGDSACHTAMPATDTAKKLGIPLRSFFRKAKKWKAEGKVSAVRVRVKLNPFGPPPNPEAFRKKWGGWPFYSGGTLFAQFPTRYLSLVNHTGPNPLRRETLVNAKNLS